MLVDDLREHRLLQMPSAFPSRSVRILTLVMSHPQVLRQRIAGRNEGWTNQEAAVAWNEAVFRRSPLPCETKIDVTHITPEEVLARALALLYES